MSLQADTYIKYQDFLETAWQHFLSGDNNKKKVSANTTDVLKRAVLKKYFENTDYI